jgi:hypothetical protein
MNFYSCKSERSPYIYRGSSLPPFGGVGSLVESELGRIWPPPPLAGRGPPPPLAGRVRRRPSRVGVRQLRRPVRDANSERVPRPWRDGFAP